MRSPGSAGGAGIPPAEPGFRVEEPGFRAAEPGFRVEEPGFRVEEPGFRAVRRPGLRWPGFRNFPVRAPLSGPSARAGFVGSAHHMPPHGGVLAASEPGELGSNKSGPGVGNGRPVFRVRGARVPRFRAAEPENFQNWKSGAAAPRRGAWAPRKRNRGPILGELRSRISAGKIYIYIL